MSRFVGKRGILWPAAVDHFEGEQRREGLPSSVVSPFCVVTTLPLFPPLLSSRATFAGALSALQSVCLSVARPACLPSSSFASYSFLSAFSRPWRGPPNDRLRDRERRERREERAEGRREDSVRRTDERQRHLSRARPAPRAHGGTIRSGAHSVRFLDLFFILGPFLRNRTTCLPPSLSLSPLDSSTISQAFLLRGRAPLLPFRPPARHLLAEARGPFCAPKWGKGRGRRFPRVTG